MPFYKWKPSPPLLLYSLTLASLFCASSLCHSFLATPFFLRPHRRLSFTCEPSSFEFLLSCHRGLERKKGSGDENVKTILQCFLDAVKKRKRDGGIIKRCIGSTVYVEVGNHRVRRRKENKRAETDFRGLRCREIFQCSDFSDFIGSRVR